MIFVNMMSQHGSNDISVIYKSILMILGAFKSCECLLSNASKITAIGSPVFAGDDFEKCLRKIFFEFYYYRISIDYIPLL